MSLAPEQTDAVLGAVGEGPAEPDGVGSALGPIEPVGLGPLESDGLGEKESEEFGPTLGARLGLRSGPRLAGLAGDGALEAVPGPQPANTSTAAATNRERRTVPAVRGRMGVTRQA